MRKCIDADRLINDVRRSTTLGGSEWFVKKIREQPTVEAEDVVKCEECKYFNTEERIDDPISTICMCTFYSQESKVYKKSDGYCDAGKRREADENAEIL